MKVLERDGYRIKITGVAPCTWEIITGDGASHGQGSAATRAEAENAAEAALATLPKDAGTAGQPLNMPMPPAPGNVVPEIADEDKEKAAKPATLRGKLPESFPARELLEGAGVTTYAQARKWAGGDEQIKGVGEATREKIKEAAGVHDDSEE